MSNLAPSMGQCGQCGTFHPPLQAGQVCPMAPTTGAATKEGEGKNIDMTELFSSLRNIVTSQIQTKEIKDHKKLFQHTIIELTKILEGYEEK